ncbi:hypothetical protein [Pseudomonas synxantha]|nr:hypothetical protein [Pseudomonas synxantha]
MQTPRYIRYTEVMLSQASQLPHLGSVVAKIEFGVRTCSLARQLIGKLPDRTHHFLRTVLNFHNHRTRLGCQGQALLGLQATVGHQRNRIAGHVLVLAHYADDFLGGFAGA